MPRRPADPRSRARRDATAAVSAGAAARVPDVGRALLGLLLALVLVAQAMMVVPLRRLPSELYGGDLYYQLGCVHAILATGNPMATCSTCKARPGYLPAYGTMIALISRGTGLAPERAMLATAVALKLVAVVAMFALLAPLAGAGAAVAGAALWYATHPGLILRYTSWSAEIVVPLLLLALLRVLESPRASRAALLALALGVAGYSHAVAFTGGVAIVVIAGLARWALAPRDAIARAAAGWALAAAIAGVVIALGYWYQPIFVLHGRTSAHYTEWNGGATLTTLGARLAHAGRFLAAQADVHSLPAALASLLAVLGVAAAWPRRAEPRVRIALVVAGATFAWCFHDFLTEPLLHAHFVPDYVASMWWGEARLLLVVLPLAWLLARRAPGAAGSRALARLAATAGLGVAMLAVAAAAAFEQGGAPEVVDARSPLPRYYADFAAWVRAHTRPGEVFLSNPEASFMVSALTGRPVLVTRRAQNDAFADMDVRVRDAALILYGNDDSLRRAAIARWKVRYVVWDEQWARTEFDTGPNGEMLDYYDPLLYFADDATDSLLTRAGVRITRRLGWVDPVLRTDDVRQFPLSIVTRDNWRQRGQPWSAGLDRYTRKLWSAESEGREALAIYAIEVR